MPVRVPCPYAAEPEDTPSPVRSGSWAAGRWAP